MSHFGEAIVPVLIAILFACALVTWEAPPMQLHIEGF